MRTRIPVGEEIPQPAQRIVDPVNREVMRLLIENPSITNRDVRSRVGTRVHGTYITAARKMLQAPFEFRTSIENGQLKLLTALDILKLTDDPKSQVEGLNRYLENIGNRDRGDLRNLALGEPRTYRGRARKPVDQIVDSAIDHMESAVESFQQCLQDGATRSPYKCRFAWTLRLIVINAALAEMLKALQQEERKPV